MGRGGTVTKEIKKPGSGQWWLYIALVVVGFAIYSAAVAVNTRDDCGDAPKEWNIFPPEWDCNTQPGFG